MQFRITFVTFACENEPWCVIFRVRVCTRANKPTDSFVGIRSNCSSFFSSPLFLPFYSFFSTVLAAQKFVHESFCVSLCARTHARTPQGEIDRFALEIESVLCLNFSPVPVLSISDASDEPLYVRISFIFSLSLFLCFSLYLSAFRKILTAGPGCNVEGPKAARDNFALLKFCTHAGLGFTLFPSLFSASSFFVQPPRAGKHRETIICRSMCLTDSLCTCK